MDCLSLCVAIATVLPCSQRKLPWHYTFRLPPRITVFKCRNMGPKAVSLTDQQLQEIWECVVSSTRIPATFTGDLPTTAAVTTAMMTALSTRRPEDATKTLNPELRSRLTAFLSQRLCAMEKKVDHPHHEVSVVVGNSHVARSMHVMTKLRVGPHDIEMNADQFGALRFELARALKAAEVYEA